MIRAARPEVGAREQGLDALVDVAELLEADHGLAVAGEAEVAGLGMPARTGPTGICRPSPSTGRKR